VVGLEAANCNLRVAAAVHGPLIDVCAADDDVLRGTQASGATSRRAVDQEGPKERLNSVQGSYVGWARCWRTSSSVIIIFECTCERQRQVFSSRRPAQPWCSLGIPQVNSNTMIH